MGTISDVLNFVLVNAFCLINLMYCLSSFFPFEIARTRLVPEWENNVLKTASSDIAIASTPNLDVVSSEPEHRCPSALIFQSGAL